MKKPYIGIPLNSANKGPLAVDRFSADKSPSENKKEGKKEQCVEAHSRKLESLGSLAGGVAHDLNNILTGVLGHVSYLRLTCPELATDGGSLLAIEDGARRAAAITQQILDFARGEPAQLRPVRLRQAIESVISLVSTTLPKNIQLQFEDASSPCDRVMGDESQLSQIVLNLLLNARDALPGGGRIELRIDRVKLTDAGQEEGLELRAGEYLRLEFADNGVGIPEAVRHRVFEPFFTTKSGSAGGGTGLGLSTVLAVVKSHNGIIQLDSKEGEGSRFEIFLPLWRGGSEDSTAPSGGAAQSLDARTRGAVSLDTAAATGERILVVDDEEAVRTVIRRCLEHLGYQVAVAGSGDEALACYGAGDPFHLVILDMMMPQMSGDEVFRRLREIDQQVGVLVASGYSSDTRARKILDNGGLGFIQKPFAVEELAREVRRCLNLRRPEIG